MSTKREMAEKLSKKHALGRTSYWFNYYMKMKKVELERRFAIALATSQITN